MSSHESAEAHYDHLDQQGEWNAAEMRQMSGYEPEHDNADFTAEAIESRLGPAAMGAFGNVELETETLEPHDGSNPKDGLNHRAWAKHLQDPAERERIQRHIAEARQSMHDTSRKD